MGSTLPLKLISLLVASVLDFISALFDLHGGGLPAKPASSLAGMLEESPPVKFVSALFDLHRGEMSIKLASSLAGMLDESPPVEFVSALFDLHGGFKV